MTINRDAAFSLKIPEIVLWVGWGVLAVWAIWSWIKWDKKSRRQRVLSLGLLIGGGLSNLLDRHLQGGVVDFFDVQVWPIFNLADVAITLGVIGLVWYSWRSSRKKSHTSHAKGAYSKFKKSK